MNKQDLFAPRINPGWRKGKNPFEGQERAMTIWAGGEPQRKLSLDEDVKKVAQIAEGKTHIRSIDLANFTMLYKFYLKQVVGNVPVVVLEFGVANGGSLLAQAYLAGKFLGERIQVVGFDTFDGQPANSQDKGIDHHITGEFNPGKDYEILAGWAGKEKNLILVKGRFEDTLRPYLMHSIGQRRILICHIDCDNRESSEYVFRQIYPYMLPGGYYVFDDALHPTCMGQLEMIEDVVVREFGLNAEQNFPTLIFRHPGGEKDAD